LEPGPWAPEHTSRGLGNNSTSALGFSSPPLSTADGPRGRSDRAVVSLGQFGIRGHLPPPEWWCELVLFGEWPGSKAPSHWNDPKHVAMRWGLDPNPAFAKFFSGGDGRKRIAFYPSTGRATWTVKTLIKGVVPNFVGLQSVRHLVSANGKILSVASERPHRGATVRSSARTPDGGETWSEGGDPSAMHRRPLWNGLFGHDSAYVGKNGSTPPAISGCLFGTRMAGPTPGRWFGGPGSQS